MMYREEILLRKQRVANLSRDEEEAGGRKGGGGGCVTHSLTLMERAETAGEKGKRRREKKRDAASERNCVGEGDGEYEESLLVRLHG